MNKSPKHGEGRSFVILGNSERVPRYAIMWTVEMSLKTSVKNWSRKQKTILSFDTMNLYVMKLNIYKIINILIEFLRKFVFFSDSSLN